MGIILRVFETRDDTNGTNQFNIEFHLTTYGAICRVFVSTRKLEQILKMGSGRPQVNLYGVKVQVNSHGLMLSQSRKLYTQS